MTATPLDDLIGFRLSSVEHIEDYDQFVFSDEAAVLSVYNPWELRGSATGSFPTVAEILNRRLVAVVCRPDVAELTFDEGWVVVVDLRDESYSGPEAMQLDRPGKSIVVWN